MAIEKIIEEIRKLSREEKRRILRILESDLDADSDQMEKFIGSIKTLSHDSKGSTGFEEDLYGGPSPL
jgi:predicted transcriptional regulator